MLESATKTPLSEYGEFGLIELLTNKIKLKNKSSVIGVGDDAAVVFSKNKHTVISKDMLIEDIHFDITYCPLKHIGYKAIASNLSDIAAMNAVAEQILVGIAVSSRYTVEAIEEIYAGMQICCQRYGIDLIGGDTTPNPSGLCISVTAIGYANKSDIVRRNTAKANDLICVSGDLGAAYAGLLILEREKKVFLENPNNQPDLEGFDYILERQLKPEPRIDIIRKLSENKILPTAMIDISDGLASDMIHICKSSEKGCLLYEDKLPVDVLTGQVAEEFGIVPTVAALNGGEDYELLFTIKQEDYENVKQIEGISIIGHITEEKECCLVTTDKKSIPLTSQGWDAYLKRNL